MSPASERLRDKTGRLEEVQRINFFSFRDERKKKQKVVEPKGKAAARWRQMYISLSHTILFFFFLYINIQSV